MVTFRPARPEDADEAVKLIHVSGPADFDYVLPDALAFLRYAFVQGMGRFGYRHHSVGERDGRIVAVGVGWTARENVGFALAAAGMPPSKPASTLVLSDCSRQWGCWRTAAPSRNTLR